MTRRVRVRCTALRVVDDSFPTWWEVAVVDAHGLEHRIKEKAAVLAGGGNAPGGWPFVLLLDATTTSQKGPSVQVTLLHGVETVDELSVLDIARENIEW